MVDQGVLKDGRGPPEDADWRGGVADVSSAVGEVVAGPAAQFLVGGFARLEGQPVVGLAGGWSLRRRARSGRPWRSATCRGGPLRNASHSGPQSLLANILARALEPPGTRGQGKEPSDSPADDPRLEAEPVAI